MLKPLNLHVRRNVIAYVALFVALGGTSYAATGGNFILGRSNSASTQTSLSSGAGQALKVTNTTGHGGVWASGGSAANNVAAIHGESSAGNGVEGISSSGVASGVYGQNNSQFGVAGGSTGGTAVLGDTSPGNGVPSSHAWAFAGIGSATQSRESSGFVKAMAFVDPTNAADPIQRCFNSQLSASQATTGDCGITYNRLSTGNYTLNFHFEVDDRFASVTGSGSAYDNLTVTYGNINAVQVASFRTAIPGFPAGYSDTPFTIIVY